MFNIRDTDIVIKYDPLLSNNLIAVTLLLTLLSLFDWKTERAIQNRFPVSSFLPLKKKQEGQQACSRARNLYRHKYIYGYDSDIAKRTTLYFIASGNIVDSSTSRAPR